MKKKDTKKGPTVNIDAFREMFETGVDICMEEAGKGIKSQFDDLRNAIMMSPTKQMPHYHIYEDEGNLILDLIIQSESGIGVRDVWDYGLPLLNLIGDWIEWKYHTHQRMDGIFAAWTRMKEHVDACVEEIKNDQATK